jgi:hypothetical protein
MLFEDPTMCHPRPDDCACAMLLLLTEEISVYDVEVTFNGITYTPDAVKVEPLVQKLKVVGPGDAQTQTVWLSHKPRIDATSGCGYSVCECAVFYPDLHPEHAHSTIKHNSSIVNHFHLTLDFEQPQCDLT